MSEIKIWKNIIKYLDCSNAMFKYDFYLVMLLSRIPQQVVVFEGKKRVFDEVSVLPKYRK